MCCGNYSTLAPSIAGNKMTIKMNTTEVLESWNERKGKLKQKFGFLTENDLVFEEGKKEEMLTKLQIKLGKTKDELRKIVASL